MNKSLPDKWIRKAIYDVLNNIVVDTVTVPCYDWRVTGNTIPDHYFLITNITSNENKGTSCGKRWDSTVTVEVVTSYKGTLNVGSRLLADNIADAARNLLDNLTLDVASGLEVFYQTMTLPADLSTVTGNDNVFRKFIRLELDIN